MTHETTPQITEQGRAVQALGSLIAEHSTLPAAYITLHEPLPEYDVAARLDIQVDGPEFEAWRRVLDVAWQDVVLHTTVSNTWLSFNTVWDGVRMQVAGFQNPLTADQLAAPRETAGVAA